MTGPRSIRRAVVRTLLAAAALAACGDGGGSPRDRAAPPSGDAIGGVPGKVHINPGVAVAVRTDVTNPFAGDPQAMGEGERLYSWYNCGGCHGPQGGGGMGPPLADASWIYGGDPVSIFESIVEGRPAGMPTWRGKIPDQDIWKIVAYVQALAESGGTGEGGAGGNSGGTGGGSDPGSAEGGP